MCCGDSSACVCFFWAGERERKEKREGESIVFWGRGKKKIVRKEKKGARTKRERGVEREGRSAVSSF